MQGAEQLAGAPAATRCACSSSRRRSTCSRRGCATRRTETEEVMRGRLAARAEELAYAKQCHHRIVNDSVDKAVAALLARSSATRGGSAR